MHGLVTCWFHEARLSALLPLASAPYVAVITVCTAWRWDLESCVEKLERDNHRPVLLTILHRPSCMKDVNVAIIKRTSQHIANHHRMTSKILYVFGVAGCLCFNCAYNVGPCFEIVCGCESVQKHGLFEVISFRHGTKARPMKARKWSMFMVGDWE